MPTRVTRISATTSLLLALAAGVGLLLWPCAYQGIEVEAQPGPGCCGPTAPAVRHPHPGQRRRRARPAGAACRRGAGRGPHRSARHPGHCDGRPGRLLPADAGVGGPAVPTGRCSARHRRGRLATTAKRSAQRLTNQPDKYGERSEGPEQLPVTLLTVSGTQVTVSTQGLDRPDCRPPDRVRPASNRARAHAGGRGEE
jgi:hypothetical protein